MANISITTAFGCIMDPNSNFRSFVITGETDKAEKLLKWFLHHDSKMRIDAAPY